MLQNKTEMTTFPQLSTTDATAGSKPIWEGIQKSWGMPSYSPPEQQVALMSISYENKCNYCSAG